MKNLNVSQQIINSTKIGQKWRAKAIWLYRKQTANYRSSFTFTATLSVSVTFQRLVEDKKYDLTTHCLKKTHSQGTRTAIPYKYNLNQKRELGI